MKKIFFKGINFSVTGRGRWKQINRCFKLHESLILIMLQNPRKIEFNEITEHALRWTMDLHSFQYIKHGLRFSFSLRFLRCKKKKLYGMLAYS